ncbi:DNA primase [Rickettsiales endosymbiont of Paramecium tredecaurelia]|uniref:DNA primase n=1 Tax=Candidatus Sarmatiella mevalonica TaxID=2770581 RepID=UPI0019227EE3|nr:DNA primase [Candidatus Sarmatiella mevalonica]MBL3284903.1 DNA primase [Candidatus Sarmatiella mevalonica]
MKVYQEFYQKIRDIVDPISVIGQKVVLQKISNRYKGLCPLHLEKTPSFTINPQKKFFYCFGCSTGGDVIKFTSLILNCSYKDAAIKLAQEHGITQPQLNSQDARIYQEQEEIHQILELINNFFKSSLNQQALSYLKQRAIDANLIDSFEIGFATANQREFEAFCEKNHISLLQLHRAGMIQKNKRGDLQSIFHNRITFPIRDSYGRIAGFGARTMTEAQPKYLNSPETLVFKKQELFYCEHKAEIAATLNGYIILVEGYIDAIRLHSIGYHQTVANLGTAINHERIERLFKKHDKIIVALDSDVAGYKAKIKLIEKALDLISPQKELFFLEIPIAQDPDQLILTKGKVGFDALIESKKPLCEALWEDRRNKIIQKLSKNKLTPEFKTQVMQDLCKTCEVIKAPELKKNYQQFFRDQLFYLFKNAQHLHYPTLTNNKKGNVNSQSAPQHHTQQSNLIIKHTNFQKEKIEYYIYGLLALNPSLAQDQEDKQIIDNTLNIYDAGDNARASEKAEYRIKEWLVQQIEEKTPLPEIMFNASSIDNASFIQDAINITNQLIDNFFTIDGHKRLDIAWSFIKHHYQIIQLKRELELLHIASEDVKSIYSRVMFYRLEISKIQTKIEAIERLFS